VRKIFLYLIHPVLSRRLREGWQHIFFPSTAAGNKKLFGLKSFKELQISRLKCQDATHQIQKTKNQMTAR